MQRAVGHSTQAPVARGRSDSRLFGRPRSGPNSHSSSAEGPLVSDDKARAAGTRPVGVRFPCPPPVRRRTRPSRRLLTALAAFDDDDATPQVADPGDDVHAIVPAEKLELVSSQLPTRRRRRRPGLRGGHDASATGQLRELADGDGNQRDDGKTDESGRHHPPFPSGSPSCQSRLCDRAHRPLRSSHRICDVVASLPSSRCG